MNEPLIPADHALNVALRLENMLGATLSDIEEILFYPIATALRERDQVILNAKIQTHRAVLNTCTKLGIERSRALRQHDEVLEKLSEGLRSRLKK
jgi:DNA-directed RNA polymerase specialized sigma subunit